MRARQLYTWLAGCLAGLAVSTISQAQVHLSIPEDIDPPFYADIVPGFLPHTEDWAAVFFYRTPACVPADFNLFEFLDFSGQPFACELQITGRTFWRSLDDPYPASSIFYGTGVVPVWFVRWSELQAAVADNELTVPELAALPSLLIGSASFFVESTRNDIVPQRGGNEALVASGTLTDGRSFQVELTEQFREGEHHFPHVRIEFR